jgi:hypothetical protein
MVGARLVTRATLSAAAAISLIARLLWDPVITVLLMRFNLASSESLPFPDGFLIASFHSLVG